MTKLRLSRTELSKDLGNTTCLDTAFEQLVEFDGSCRESDKRLAILERVGSSFEVHGHHTLDELLDLENLGFANALDIGKLADCCMSNRFDRVVPRVLKLLNVVGGNAMIGQTIDRLVGDGDLYEFSLHENTK